mgnify:CR=1 FL=1
MLLRPPRSTQDRSSAAAEVYKRQVQEQLRIARGRRLRIRQEDVRLKGWAIECRINAAVSYTHLRAHETVLDLVCRLLLEKKQQHNNNNNNTNKP